MSDNGDRVIVRKVEHATPYPWMFSVVHGGRQYDFAGIPNQCETRRSAAIRGWWRLRWLKSGEFDRRYTS